MHSEVAHLMLQPCLVWFGWFIFWMVVGSFGVWIGVGHSTTYFDFGLTLEGMFSSHRCCFGFGFRFCWMCGV